MMFNLGAFAGGLAQGIRSGQNMELRQRLAERAAKADEREAEVHRARMDKAAFNKDKRDRLRAANDEIAAGWPEARHSMRPMATSMDQPGSGLEGSAALAGLAAPANPDKIRSAGLMSQHKRRDAQRTSDHPVMTADEMIGRRMLTGNLLDDTDELTRMANIYKKHGLLEEMAPWMNKVYEAKKKGIPDALHLLLTGDGRAAREILKKGGINLAEDPAPANLNDPQSNLWRFRFEEGREKNIDLKELAVKFFPSSGFSQ